MSNKSDTTLPTIEAKELSIGSNKPTLIDVRSPIEFEVEHIDGAINIPLDKLEARIAEVPRQGDLVVICRSGKRAERGAYTLAGQGYNPTVLSGGMLAWRDNGLPVIKGKQMLPIERQIQLVVGMGVLTGVLLSIFVNRWFLVIPAFFGAGLTFAGLSGTCALGILLSKAPWNQLPGSGPNCCK